MYIQSLLFKCYNNEVTNNILFMAKGETHKKEKKKPKKDKK